MSIGAITGVLSGLIGLASEYIPDKDKQAEFQLKAKKYEHDLLSTILETTTVPWVDATVKILIALNAMWRPIAGAAMTAFGAYAHVNGIDIPVELHAMFDGAFPAWGASRHFNKQKAEDTRKEEIRSRNYQDPRYR